MPLNTKLLSVKIKLKKSNQTRWYAVQIRAVYKDHKIFKILKGVLLCLLFCGCFTYKSIFSLFDDSANKIKAFNLKVNCKELRLVFVHHVNTECT